MTPRAAPTYHIAVVRLSIGLVQGGALLLLYWAAQASLWPATDEMLFTPLLMVVLFVPFLALVGVDNLRSSTLALWLGTAAILCAGLGWYWIFRHATLPHRHTTFVDFYPTVIALLFIIHALITAADADRKLIASPETYFDVSLKLVSALIFAGLFASLLRGIFWASAQLFDLIGVQAVGAVINESWFWIPTSTVAASIAIHVADDRTGIVRNAARLLFGLLSWLLLPAVVVGLAFLVALPFTGLEPLWNTKYATSRLLSAAIVLILLIRCHYQDGGTHTGRSRVLVLARLIAVLMLVPCVVLAAIGLGLRVGQHGWTPQRILALAWLIVVASHAVGYVLVAISSRGTLSGLATANAVAAFVAVGLLIALSSPLADPARLSVADQVARLETGEIAADKFDYSMLASKGVRYGFAALQRLKVKRDGPDASYVAARADEALTRAYGWMR